MENRGRLILGHDGRWRCWWCGAASDYIAYHDNEWGVPVHDDIRLFEKICLEGFQAGLSWLTILRKREAFRRAFAGFDFRVLAAWGGREAERILLEPGIIRHRGKIASVLNNARRACELVHEAGSLDRYLWSFASRPPADLARELKRRGWTFVGPTTVESLMQAAGMVDAHEPGCWRRGRCAVPASSAD
ncbi:MAG: DNA-3-methyladenine glycosylase I [Bryobacteraceae bacterium]|nr:DNA-3-methyladenine glycosylase I [Bryobacteraceae bacterium]